MAAGVYRDEMLGPTFESQLRTRAAAVGQNLLTVLATSTRRGDRDSALLTYASDHDLVLITRNLRDFLLLHEHWVVSRYWRILPRPHAGILVPLGPVPDLQWA